MRKLFLALLATLTLSGCGYNEFQRLDEAVTAAWSEVVNNYQRRADLIPNLVATVKGAADFEKGTLEAVVNARASVGQLKVTPEMISVGKLGFERCANNACVHQRRARPARWPSSCTRWPPRTSPSPTG